MKKIISVVLVAVLVLSLVPFTAFAASNSTAATDGKITSNVCSIVYTSNGQQTTYGSYKTLDAAFEALSDLYKAPLKANIADGDDADTNNNNELYAAAGSPVIKLNGNFDGAACLPNWVIASYDMNNVVTIVIDGAKSATENYTISCGAITLFDALAFYNLTVKNTNITFTAPLGDHNIRWNGNSQSYAPGESFTVFENCVIDQNATAADNGTGNGGLFKMNGKLKAEKDNDGDGINDDTVTTDIFNLTLKDCTINSASALGLQVHWGADANVYLKNTTWALDGAASTGSNDCILKAYQSGDIYFNIDGTSKLIGKAVEGSLSTALLKNHNNIGGTCVWELEAGAELVIDSQSSTVTKQLFYAPEYTKTQIIDKGVVYKAGKVALENGVTLPALEGVTAWAANGEIAAIDDRLIADVEDVITVTPIKGEIISVLNGAGYKEGGMAFGMAVSDSVTDILGDKATYGLIVAPTDYVMFGFDKGALNPGQFIDLTTDSKGIVDKNGTKTVIIGFDGIPVDDYDAKYLDVSVRGYISYKNAAGDTVTIYTPNTYSISYAELAAAAAK